VLAGLASSDVSERRAACRDSVGDPSAVLLLASLCEALGDTDRSVSRAASDALLELGARFGETTEALHDALTSDQPRRRWGAAHTLARLGPPSPRLLPALVEAMDSPHGDVRWTASRILVETGRLHDEVLTVVAQLARAAESAAVRRMAIFALRELAPDQPAAASALLDASHDAEPAVRRAAYTAMTALLDPPDAVIERLTETLATDSDTASRRIAAMALGEIGAGHGGRLPSPSLLALREAASTRADEHLSLAAGRALAHLGGDGPSRT